MGFGWLGPLSFKTRGGGRVSFFGLWFTLPLAATPYLLSRGNNNDEHKRDDKRELDMNLSGQAASRRPDELN